MRLSLVFEVVVFGQSLGCELALRPNSVTVEIEYNRDRGEDSGNTSKERGGPIDTKGIKL